MSRTFGHNKATPKTVPFAKYNTAKPWRSAYNRAIRRINNVKINSADVANIDDVILIDKADEHHLGDMWSHPGD